MATPYEWKLDQAGQPIDTSPWLNGDYVPDAGRYHPNSVTTLPETTQYVCPQAYDGTQPYWEYDNTGNTGYEDLPDIIKANGRLIQPTEHEKDMLLYIDTYTSRCLITRNQGNQKLDVQDQHRFINFRLRKAKSAKAAGYITWTQSGYKIIGTITPPKDDFGVPLAQCYATAQYQIYTRNYPDFNPAWLLPDYEKPEPGLWYQYSIHAHTNDIQLPYDNTSPTQAQIEAQNDNKPFQAQNAGLNQITCRPAWDYYAGFLGSLDGNAQINIYIGRITYRTNSDDQFHYENIGEAYKQIHLMETPDPNTLPDQPNTIGIYPTGTVSKNP